jgi:hypothetical protein
MEPSSEARNFLSCLAPNMEGTWYNAASTPYWLMVRRTGRRCSSYSRVAARSALRKLLGNLLGGIARPAFSWIKRHHAQRLTVLAGEEVADESLEVGRLVRLAPRRALTEILQHQVDVPIQAIGGNDRGRLTHAELHERD